jgi:hypothetical protein
MRYMLRGYGTGSQDGTGQAKQYRTLRGSLGPATFQPNGVTSGTRSVPCIRFSGQTRKVSKESTNNEMALIIHGISEDEALEVAGRFVEYALYLRALRDRPKKTAAFENSGPAFAEIALKALSDMPRARGVMHFLQKLKEQWSKDGERDGSFVESSLSVRHLVTYDNSDLIELYSMRSRWRKACAKALSNLLTIYADEHEWDERAGRFAQRAAVVQRVKLEGAPE